MKTLLMVESMYLAQCELTGKYNQERKELKEELLHTKAVVREIREDHYFQVKWIKEDMEKLNAEREELQEAYEGIKEELARANQCIRMEEED